MPRRLRLFLLTSHTAFFVFPKKTLKTSLNVIGAPHGSQFYPVNARLRTVFQVSALQAMEMPQGAYSILDFIDTL
jgi:hypothetical protein